MIHSCHKHMLSHFQYLARGWALLTQPRGPAAQSQPNTQSGLREDGKQWTKILKDICHWGPGGEAQVAMGGLESWSVGTS